MIRGFEQLDDKFGASCVQLWHPHIPETADE